MKRYDIDWHLKFSGKLDTKVITVIEKVTKRLSITEIISKESCGCDWNWTYKIHRSLDICLPVILTECDEFKITTYRDNVKNVFVVQVNM
jgi:hypothetical protein